MDQPPIPFNKPHVTGREAKFINEALENGHLSGNGQFAQNCARWLTEHIGSRAAFMTPSCTAALEMAMLLADVGPGDEVIMPSFTFVSCANAVALRGGIPVFVDLDPATLTVDPEAVSRAMTSRTKAVIVVHYAGVGADVAKLQSICDEHEILLVEDAAHCIHASRHGRPLGSFGAMSTFSFHETKNVQCGEGGALLINDERLVARAEVIQEKGTNRRRFLRGQVDKYTWVGVGSSFLMSDIAAAFLWAQMLAATEITQSRLDLWDRYQEAFRPFAEAGVVRLPTVPAGCEHNAHIFALRLADIETRDAFIARLAESAIQSVFHYVPLHSSPAGRALGRTAGSLELTDAEAGRLVRLPLYADLGSDVERVIDAATTALSRLDREMPVSP
jgi:dTDP-4-amino-4,6-dideoxygalactose transaminase